MKRTTRLMCTAVLTASLGAAAPVNGQSQTPASDARRPATVDRGSDKKTSYGERVGEDVPSQGTATDQRGRTAGAATDNAISATDRTFLTTALEGNQAEIALAGLATEKASSPAVKELASMLEKHHGEAQTKLKQLAASSGTADGTPPLAPHHKQLQDRLSRLEGKAFDAAYAAEMVKDHEKDIKTYEKASRDLRHAGLKAYASETLPTLKQHLEKARSAQSATARAGSLE